MLYYSTYLLRLIIWLMGIAVWVVVFLCLEVPSRIYTLLELTLRKRTAPNFKQKRNESMNTPKQNLLKGLSPDELEGEIEWILEAKAEGYSWKQLANRYGVSVKTLIKIVKGERIK